MARVLKVWPVLAGLLLLTNIGGFVWYQFFRPTSVERFQQQYPLIDLSRNFIDQENFIVNIQPLREKLNQIVKEAEPNQVGVYFEVLNTGANISINQDERFLPASLIKMPTAMAVMKKIERGEWHLDDQLVIFFEDRDHRFGELYKKEVGTRLTIEELLKETLINSDDTAHKVLIRNLPAESFEEIFSGLGMEELYDQDYNITAKEYSRVFRALYTSSFLKREYSQQLLDWLTQSSFDQYLGGGMPAVAVFAHKIGEHDESKTYLDSGIVYLGSRPFLLTVMVKVNNGGEEEAQKIMARISSVAYEYIKNY